MRNRAKCKLCGDIIESLHDRDCVECSCGEISVDGGAEYYKSSAKDYGNFLRVDNNGQEIPVQFKSSLEDLATKTIEPQQELPQGKLSKHEILSMLEEVLKGVERLPDHAMSLPINHYDFYAFGTLVLSALQSD